MGNEILAQLSACTEAITYEDKEAAFAAIWQLSSCGTHHGVHHFAVVGDGLTIVMSKTGLLCLEQAGKV